MSEGIEASERMLADWNQRIQERADRYQAMAERVKDLSIIERSGDGAIEVTIASNGIMTGLSIAEAARNRRMSDLASEIMRSVQRAQARIPELLREAMVDTIGLEDETANKLFEDAKQHFPAPPEDSPQPEDRDHDLRLGPTEEEEEPESGPRSAPQPRNSRGRDGETGEDDEFDGKSIWS